MKRYLTLLPLLAMPVLFGACEEDTTIEVDICSDDLDCDDGLICEITGQDDGLCVNDG